MGTNFYWAGAPEDCDTMDPEWHIGKRSAAGRYCWDCRVTLCVGGEADIHYGRSSWHDACPRCGAAPIAAGLNSAAVELGFSKPATDRDRGVTSAASFSWAQEPSQVRSRCERAMDEALVRDEYGDTLTGREFLRMLASNCPIEFTQHVGAWFS